MAVGSSLDDMGGKFLSSVQAKFPQVNILRPLLEVWKEDLQEVCQNEGVEWTEDQLYSNVRKHIRKIVQENEELVPGIAGLMKTCQEARRQLKHQGIVACTFCGIYCNLPKISPSPLSFSAVDMAQTEEAWGLFSNMHNAPQI